MLIPGIIASSISGSKVVTGSYESIATVTVGSGGSSTVTFSSIPSTYTHLQIRGIVACTVSGTDQNYMLVAANSDTTVANYRTHAVYGTGGSAAAIDSQSYGGALYTGMAPKTGATSIFGGLVIDILDYANTNKYKTFRTLTGNDMNGSGNIFLSSAVWLNTSAITTLTMSIAFAGNIAQYSSFALYGIKG